MSATPLPAGQRTDTATFIVNLHGIGRPLKAFDPGEEPFWITEACFEAVLDCVQERRGSVALTFDDGNLSDHAIAAPSLRQRGLTARFFVVAGRLGHPAYLSKGHVRDLQAEGFEIGSHGFGHVDWTQAGDEQLLQEIKDAKAILEDVIGAPVRGAAIPFGRYDRRVLAMLRRCRFGEVFCSDGGPRLTAAWPIPRRSMRQGIEAADLPRLVEAASGFWARARNEARLRLKASLRRGIPQSPR